MLWPRQPLHQGPGPRAAASAGPAPGAARGLQLLFLPGVWKHRPGRRLQHQQAQQLPDVSTGADAAVQVCAGAQTGSFLVQSCDRPSPPPAPAPAPWAVLLPASPAASLLPAAPWGGAQARVPCRAAWGVSERSLLPTSRHPRAPFLWPSAGPARYSGPFWARSLGLWSRRSLFPPVLVPHMRPSSLATISAAQPASPRGPTGTEGPGTEIGAEVLRWLLEEGRLGVQEAGGWCGQSRWGAGKGGQWSRGAVGGPVDLGCCRD